MGKLTFLDGLTKAADTAHVPELRIIEANKSEDRNEFEEDIKHIANMLLTIARASKMTTAQVWDLLLKRLQLQEGQGHSLHSLFESKMELDS